MRLQTSAPVTWQFASTASVPCGKVTMESGDTPATLQALALVVTHPCGDMLYTHDPVVGGNEFRL